MTTKSAAAAAGEWRDFVGVSDEGAGMGCRPLEFPWRRRKIGHRPRSASQIASASGGPHLHHSGGGAATQDFFSRAELFATGSKCPGRAAVRAPAAHGRRGGRRRGRRVHHFGDGEFRLATRELATLPDSHLPLAPRSSRRAEIIFWPTDTVRPSLGLHADASAHRWCTRYSQPWPPRR